MELCSSHHSLRMMMACICGETRQSLPSHNCLTAIYDTCHSVLCHRSHPPHTSHCQRWRPCGRFFVMESSQLFPLCSTFLIRPHSYTNHWIFLGWCLHLQRWRLCYSWPLLNVCTSVSAYYLSVVALRTKVVLLKKWHESKTRLLGKLTKAILVDIIHSVMAIPSTYDKHWVLTDNWGVAKSIQRLIASGMDLLPLVFLVF